jgi:hypothetical protein
MKLKHGIEINIEASANLIDRCRELVKEDFDSFVEHCIDKVRGMIEVRDGD